MSPIPALKVNPHTKNFGVRVKSPQTWRNKKSYPSDRLIARRRKSAFQGVKMSMTAPKRAIKKMAAKRGSAYFGTRPKGFWQNKLVRKIIKLGVFGIIGLIILGFIVFTYYSSQVPTREEFIAAAEGNSTQIYDRTGEHMLYNVNTEAQKTWIPLDRIPEHVKWALISIEDDQFFAHRGFDLPALIKVGIHEVFGIGPQRGGSTITQQLVKNALLSPERTYRRKIKEMIISYQMEKKFGKDEILELYFNIVPYGSTAYGLEAAAETYFGKRAENLDLAEGAVLAAMLKATTYYSPYGNHLDELFQRQKLVLNKMAELGYVSQDEAETAKAKQLEFKRLKTNIQAPHFVFYIKELLAEKYGEEIVEKGGLKVITTLDYNKQKIAEDEIAKGVERNEVKYGGHNAALVSIDARTGEVLSMVGSRDYFNEEYDGAVNVTMRPRQPGSSFKPVVYAAAFMKGLSPETILFDTLTTFKTEIGVDYEPHNYNDKEYGPVSIRKALAGSLNIPAVKTLYLTGVENVLDLAERIGYTTFEDRSRFGLSLVLGGGEVKLVDHVRAFATFAENGKRKNLQYLLRVENGDGKVLEKFKPEDNEGEEVMDSNIARTINNILSDNQARAYIFGEINYLTLGDRPVAAKTGTTNDYLDGWTIGYTSSVVTGVWVGNNDNTPMKGAAAGGNVAAPIWNAYMAQVLNGTPIEHFEEPDKIANLPEKPMLNGKIAGENIIKIDKASGKLATDLTPPKFIEEKIFRELHSILHYVNKNNILGPVPEHPENDPNYETFEQGIKKWAEENEYEITEEPPTEYDDIHTDENRPNLEILEPKNNTHFSSLDLNIEVRVQTKRTMNRVEYYIDDQLIATQKIYPFNLKNYQLLGFNNGQKNLRVIAYDDVDNSREQSINIYLTLPDQYTQPVIWLTTEDNEEIYQEEFPHNIRVMVNNYTLYDKVDFFIKREGASSQWIDYRKIDGAQAEILLLGADPGDYTFYVILTGKDGQTLQDAGIRVRVLE
ncbi:MAG: transglycosylase domain-containing protein [Candidatus Kuenenbacteria bacterium]